MIRINQIIHTLKIITHTFGTMTQQGIDFITYLSLLDYIPLTENDIRGPLLANTCTKHNSDTNVDRRT